MPADSCLDPKPSLVRDLRVLIVDDSDHFRRAAQSLFELMPRVGMVATAGSGEAALALIAGDAFDLVLLDCSMEGLNGLEVARRLSGQPKAPTIVMASLYDEPEYRSAALSAGATEFVSKVELAAEIEPLLERLFSRA